MIYLLCAWRLCWIISIDSLTNTSQWISSQILYGLSSYIKFNNRVTTLTKRGTPITLMIFKLSLPITSSFMVDQNPTSPKCITRKPSKLHKYAQQSTKLSLINLLLNPTWTSQAQASSPWLCRSRYVAHYTLRNFEYAQRNP